MAMATSSRSGSATGVVFSEVFGMLGLIISLVELFVSAPLIMALKCSWRKIQLGISHISETNSSCIKNDKNKK